MLKRYALLLLLLVAPICVFAQAAPSYTVAEIALLKYAPTTVPTFSYGAAPAGIAFDGQHIWIASSGDGRVIPLNTFDGSGAALGPGSVGTSPWALAYDGEYMWVTSYPDSAVYKFRPSGGSPISYPIKYGSRGIAFDGTYMWIANQPHNCVTRIRAIDGAFATCFPIGKEPMNVAFDGTDIWVTNFGDNTVSKLNTQTGAVIGTYSSGGSQPWGIAFVPEPIYGGARLMVVTNAGSNTAVLMLLDGSVNATIPVGLVPRGVIYDGHDVWVANSSSSSLSKIDWIDGGTTVTNYPVGKQPYALAFDGANVWAVNYGSNSVSKR
ncbi:conserved hypothetical protein [Candidatus Koribacter versatilis Ellin345]|uniref:40-residue YVTN beta-propeller repeat protein n=1 Tax=Koribacter versatilis (strain Ellin345) TaxID=204669 RepID=Q1II64_KORVE|nr:hypothetical protein [Candidatus Koribacter versatilis]ABF43436.1 conserved hypothetical protein [Candidatus Koribacter versatilis Ellin345]